jgi:hypothetical protein
MLSAQRDTCDGADKDRKRAQDDERLDVYTRRATGGEQYRQEQRKDPILRRSLADGVSDIGQNGPCLAGWIWLSSGC